MASSPADDAAAPGPEEEVAERLRHAPLTIIGHFGAASNATLLVWLGDERPRPPPDATVEDLDPRSLAVYKPRDGERPLWDFPEGTLHRREVAAFAVSQALGWGLVPATVRRETGPAGAGSVQRFVPHDPERHYFWLLEHGGEDVLSRLRAMVVFDLVIDNADRKGGHVLLEDGDVRLIDHGVCFSADRKLRTVAWDFAGEPVPAGLREDVAALEDLLGDGEVGARLADLLTGPEVAALRERAGRVAQMERFPEPSGPRPYPWPLL